MEGERVNNVKGANNVNTRSTDPYQPPATGDMQPCRGCGRELHVSAASCPQCGARTGSHTGGKSKVVAALLAFFLGGLGIHRFYLGQWWGLFYLLFCWTLIPGLIAFVETIVFLLTDQQKWDDRYNNGLGSSGGGGSVAAVILGLLVAVFGLVFVIGILAAIALPAYQDFTLRSRVSAAYVQAQTVMAGVQQYAEAAGQLPDATELPVADVSSPGVESIEWTGEAVVITMQNLHNGNRLQIVPDASSGFDALQWKCSAIDISERYLPGQCRSSADSGASVLEPAYGDQ